MDFFYFCFLIIQNNQVSVWIFINKNMKYIIVESRLLEVALKWLVNFYGDLYRDEVASEAYPRHNFYMENGEIIFDSYEDRVVYNSELIKKPLEDHFSLDHKQVKEVVQRWLSKVYDIHPKKIYPGSFDHVEI